MTSPVRLSSEKMKTLPQEAAVFRGREGPPFSCLGYYGVVSAPGEGTRGGQVIILAGEIEGTEVEVAMWRGNMEQSRSMA